MDKRLKERLNLQPHYNISDSIPIKSVSNDGIIELKKGLYSKTYKVQDINFGIARTADRGVIASKYANVLRSLDPAYDVQICVYNHNADLDYLSDNILLKETGDRQDALRQDINRIISRNISEGNNRIKRDIYMTITIPSENMQTASTDFAGVEHNTVSLFKSIPGCAAKPLNALKRLNLLHDIYHGGDEDEISEYGYVGREKIRKFSLENLYEMGVTATELVQPASMEFKNDYFIMGDKYGRVMSIKSLPTIVMDSFLKDFSNFSFNMIFSINARQYDAAASHEMVKRQRTNAAGLMAEAMREASQKGYDAALTNPDLATNFNEANALLQDIERRDQKLFETRMHVCIFGDTKEDLDHNCNTFMTKCRSKNTFFSVQTGLQENAFISAIPLGIDMTPHSRTLTTEVLKTLIPFSAQEMTQKSGTVYGLNKITHNVITFNRGLGDNFSMLILGSSGSGKSFFAKKEILSTYLNGIDADVVILDPQSEYGKLTEAVGGQEIIIKGAGEHHINPMDISGNYGENPIAEKVTFIQSVCSEMLGYPPNATQKTAIAISAKACYDDWRKSQGDESTIPTLRTFYNELINYYNSDNGALADVMDVIKAVEFYVMGVDTLFDGKTNVNTEASFKSYNISELGESIRPLAMLVILDAIMQQASRNRKLGRFTFIYIDEMHLLFRNQQTAAWIKALWKTARKYKAAPCGITQDVEDLLSSDVGRGVLTNTSFIVLLKQATMNSSVLADQLILSPQQLEYVTDTPAGEGILVIQNASRYTGGVIPFEDHYPEDSELYRICQTTDMRADEDD